MKVFGQGYMSFSKVQNFGQSQVIKSNVTLQAGKDKDGNYRKEYIDVQFSGQLSSEILHLLQGDISKLDGCKVDFTGARLRCTPWQDRSGQKRKAIFVEVFEARILEAANPAYQNQNQGGFQGGYQQQPAQNMPPQQAPQQAPRQAPPPQYQQNMPPQQQAPRPYTPPHTSNHQQSHGGRPQGQGFAPQGQPPQNMGAPVPPPQGNGRMDLENIPF